MSSRFSTWQNISAIISTLSSMKTIKSSAIEISSLANSIYQSEIKLDIDLDSTPICKANSVTNHTITFKGSSGNLPRLGLWTSIERGNKQIFYSTSNTTDVLTLSTSDGRDDNVKLCNGVGKCDFSSGTCSCPYVS